MEHFPILPYCLHKYMYVTFGVLNCNFKNRMIAAGLISLADFISLWYLSANQCRAFYMHVCTNPRTYAGATVL